MKKKLLSALLCLVLALTLLPTAALAAPTRLKSVNLVIDLPKAGDPNDGDRGHHQIHEERQHSGLLANGAGILYTEWQGDDVETDDGYAFRAGTTYLVNIKLAFDTTKGYCANYKTVGGENIVGPDTFSATVNGVPATIRTSAQYYPTLQVSLTLEGERYTEQEKEELNADLTRKTTFLRQAKRAMATPRTQAVAESKQLENFVNGVTVMTDANHVLENTDSIRTLILDTNEKITDGTCFFICYAKYLKELWLSDKVDVYQFIQAMDSYLWLPIAGLYRWERQSDLPFYTAETVVYPPNPLCPRSRQPRLSAAIRSPTPSRPTPAMTSTPPKRRATPPRRATGAPPTSTPCRFGRPTVSTPTRRPASMPDAITIPAPSAASASTMRATSLPITRIRRSSSRQKSSPTRITASIPRRRPTSA